jgi:hypothetical protein
VTFDYQLDKEGGGYFMNSGTTMAGQLCLALTFFVLILSGVSAVADYQYTAGDTRKISVQLHPKMKRLVTSVQQFFDFHDYGFLRKDNLRNVMSFELFNLARQTEPSRGGALTSPVFEDFMYSFHCLFEDRLETTREITVAQPALKSQLSLRHMQGLARKIESVQEIKPCLARYL